VRTPKRNRRDPTGRDELVRRIDRGQEFCPVPRILRSGDQMRERIGEEAIEAVMASHSTSSTNAPANVRMLR
jgi:hypothetical protein